MKVDENDLLIDTRYWLDYQKDVSGVYDGRDDRAIYFKDIEGNNPYAFDEDGRVPFPIYYDKQHSFLTL